MKNNQCVICNWKGKTHRHHIIPIKDLGEDNENNIIEICPNHHSEACGNEKEFAIKYNLKGERMSDQKISDLQEAAIIFSNENPTCDEVIKLQSVSAKYGFDKYDYVAIMMGVTRNRVITIHESSIIRSHENDC